MAKGKPEKKPDLTTTGSLFRVSSLAAFIWFAAGSRRIGAAESRWDVLVDGATPAGVCAAVGAAREGAKVVLIEPTRHLGGVNTGGLCFSDSNQMDRTSLLWDLYPLPGAKADANNGIAKQFSMGLIGGGDEWCEANPHDRQRIWETHRQYTLEMYQIPYRAITPRQTECENLLVPVAVSATHVAYSSIRVEPAWMVIGHSAGIAAKTHLPVQQLAYATIKARLLAQHQMVDLAD